MPCVVRVALILGSALVACGRGGAPPQFTGSARCAGCHAEQSAAWVRSQHSVAMQRATPRSVLAPFRGERFTHEGVTSTFHRRGDAYLVRTEGADGLEHEYRVSYTFGVYPLQQYLVAFPGGRMQALSFAWDSRAAADSGQRWFFLFPGPRITHTDELHWTQRRQNWNYMCADCHSTAVRKGYDATADTFHTTYTEVSVGCESCHGPGSAHATGATWFGRITGRTVAMPLRLDAQRGRRWVLDAGARTARPAVPARGRPEIEVCAQCHARRFHIAEGYTAGRPLLDYYIPMLLERGQYWPDGQQREEVYTYGGFLQSRMYAAGVTCSDCHDPHTGKTRRPGNGVCAQCHAAAVYDTSAHHLHLADTEAARCTTCHMPTTTYMVVDPRHDHGMRVPRPSRSAALGAPDPCLRCHADRGAAWAEERIRATRPRPSPGYQRFAAAFASDERGDAGALAALDAIVRDTTQPAIVRATALSRMADYPGDTAAAAAHRWHRDASPLVRLAALAVAERWSPRERGALALAALRDSTRAIRQAGAWLLAADTTLLQRAADRRSFQRAAAEFVHSQRYNGDQPESRVALGAFLAMRGDLTGAERELRAALRIAPGDEAARVTLERVLQRRRPEKRSRRGRTG
ncbi:MAG: tetratricopeptide repeat protein [Gemmatimonadaceae bacterium]